MPPGENLTVVDPSYQAQMKGLFEARNTFFHGDRQRAQWLFQNFCSQYPSNSDGHFWLAFVMLQAGDSQGSFHEYAQSLDTAKNAGLDSAELRNNLGNLLIQNGYGQEAEYDFRRALEIDPDLVAAHANLGRMFLIQKRYAEALKELSIATEMPSPSGRLCFLRALAHLGVSESAAAKIWLEKCMQLCVNNPNPAEAGIGERARYLVQSLGRQ